MKKILSIDFIYRDFINKVNLTDLEKQVLDKYIKNDSIVKISIDVGMSYSSVSRTINEIKSKYEKYKKIELVKSTLLSEKK